MRYLAQCLRHGSESKDWDGKQVVVPQPRTKKDRREGGCPFCRVEKRKQTEKGEA